MTSDCWRSGGRRLSSSAGFALCLGVAACSGADGESEASTGTVSGPSTESSSGGESDPSSTTEESGETSSAPVCGDGNVDPGEECDDGPGNSDSGSCTSTCAVNVCGDELVGPGESCDDPDPEVCTPECLAVLFVDPIELGEGAWQHALIDDPGCDGGDYCAADLWSVQPIPPDLGPPLEQGSQRAWSSGDMASVRGPASARLWTPTLDLSGATAPITLHFDHRYGLKGESPSLVGADGAIVEVSIDGGPFENLLLPVYNGSVVDIGQCATLGATNPLLGEEAFVGKSGQWLRESVNLDAFAGQVIEIGFRLGSDCASYTVPYDVDSVTWYLDNVRLTASTVAD